MSLLKVSAVFPVSPDPQPLVKKAATRIMRKYLVCNPFKLLMFYVTSVGDG